MPVPAGFCLRDSRGTSRRDRHEKPLEVGLPDADLAGAYPVGRHAAVGDVPTDVRSSRHRYSAAPSMLNRRVATGGSGARVLVLTVAAPGMRGWPVRSSGASGKFHGHPPAPGAPKC